MLIKIEAEDRNYKLEDTLNKLGVEFELVSIDDYVYEEDHNTTVYIINLLKDQITEVSTELSKIGIFIEHGAFRHITFVVKRQLLDGKWVHRATYGYNIPDVPEVIIACAKHLCIDPGTFQVYIEGYGDKPIYTKTESITHEETVNYP